LKVKKGDKVIILSGKDKRKQAKVLRCFPKQGQVLVEGVNLKKVHKKPRKQGEKGQVVEIAFPLPLAKIGVFCPKCGKATRVGVKAEQGDKKRFCRKCGFDI